METKTCHLCGETKPLSEFHKRPETKDGRRKECKTCFQEKARQRWNNKPEEERKAINKKIRLKYMYDMSEQDYHDMQEKQEGKCFICGSKADENTKPLYVDHCHTTGKVRKLLCQHCNSGLGMFRDNPELLEKAAEYVRTHNG